MCLQVQQFDLQFGGSQHGHAPRHAGRQTVLSGAAATVAGDAVVLACGVACASPHAIGRASVQDEKTYHEKPERA